jgi:hypothetical protein
VSPALLGVWRITEAGTPPRRLRDDEIVEDVESLVRGVIGRLATTRELSEADRDELFGHLLERVVVLTAKYDRARVTPGRKVPLLLPGWLFRELRLDAIDFLRQWHGRQGQKRVVDERLLDAARRDGAGDDAGDPRADGREHPSAAGADDDERDRTVPLDWLYARGDRTAA